MDDKPLARNFERIVFDSDAAAMILMVPFYSSKNQLRQQLSGIGAASGSVPVEPAIGEVIDAVD